MNKKRRVTTTGKHKFRFPAHRIVNDAENLWLDFYMDVMPQLLVELEVVSKLGPEVIARLGRDIADAMLAQYEERWFKVQPPVKG